MIENHNGFVFNKVPDNPIEAGFMFHKLLAEDQAGLGGLCERFKVNVSEIQAYIDAFVEAQDHWMDENVAEWVIIMIRNGGDMNCQEAKEYVYTGLPGHKIESKTAYARFRAEINSLGYDFVKSLEKGILCA